MKPFFSIDRKRRICFNCKRSRMCSQNNPLNPMQPAYLAKEIRTALGMNITIYIGFDWDASLMQRKNAVKDRRHSPMDNETPWICLDCAGILYGLYK